MYGYANIIVAEEGNLHSYLNELLHCKRDAIIL